MCMTVNKQTTLITKNCHHYNNIHNSNYSVPTGYFIIYYNIMINNKPILHIFQNQHA